VPRIASSNKNAEQKAGSEVSQASLAEASIGSSLSESAPLTGALADLVKRVEGALDQKGLEALDAKLGEASSPETIRSEISRRVEDFSSALQLRPDGYVQDYTNSVNLLDNQLRMIRSVASSSPDFAVNVMGRMADTSQQILDYQQYMEQKDILASDPSLVAAHEQLRELGLELTNSDIAEILPQSITVQISELVKELKDLGSQIRDQNGEVVYTEGNLELCSKMAALLEAAKEQVFQPDERVNTERRLTEHKGG
jgi:hypothetical protein